MIDLEKKIEELRPWRYSYSHNGVTIKSDNPKSVEIFEGYGQKIITHILNVLLKDKPLEEMRALDLGCLEGHYSDILCSLGFKEVVSIDLSEGHIKRANFLLKELRNYANSTIIQGNVTDEHFMTSLGKFNVVICYGLLYHLKDPLKMFDIIEKLIPKNEDFYLLLATQYKGSYSAVVSPFPIAELQIKPLTSGQLSSGQLYSPYDGSVFERCSFRLNPAALYQTLKLYNYNDLITYDTPGKYFYSFHSNLIVTKKNLPGLPFELNKDLDIPGVSFYAWDGQSVNSYDFKRRIEARIVRFIIYKFHQLLDGLSRLVKKF